MNNHRKTIEVYDEIASEYNRRHYSHFWVNEFEFYKQTINGNTVVDLGCGAGRDVAIFADNGFDCTGIDASEGMIEQARRRAPNSRFEQRDFFNTGFEDSSFDGFWAAASFLHMPKSKLPFVLDESRRITKEGGTGFISVKEKTTMDEGVIEKPKYGGIRLYFAFYVKEELRGMLSDAGFSIVKITKKHEKDDTTWLCCFIMV